MHLLEQHHVADPDGGVVRSLTEQVSVAFGNRLPRSLIRSYLLEALPTLDHVHDQAELAEALCLIATFRLRALDASLNAATSPGNPR